MGVSCYYIAFSKLLSVNLTTTRMTGKLQHIVRSPCLHPLLTLLVSSSSTSLSPFLTFASIPAQDKFYFQKPSVVHVHESKQSTLSTLQTTGFIVVQRSFRSFMAYNAIRQYLCHCTNDQWYSFSDFRYRARRKKRPRRLKLTGLLSLFTTGLFGGLSGYPSISQRAGDTAYLRNDKIMAIRCHFSFSVYSPTLRYIAHSLFLCLSVCLSLCLCVYLFL